MKKTTLTGIDEIRRKLRELNGYWAETSEQKKAIGRTINFSHPAGGAKTEERTEITLLLRGATDHVLRKRSWLVHDLQFSAYGSATHFVENGVIDVEFTTATMTVNEYRRQPA